MEVHNLGFHQHILNGSLQCIVTPLAMVGTWTDDRFLSPVCIAASFALMVVQLNAQVSSQKLSSIGQG